MMLTFGLFSQLPLSTPVILPQEVLNETQLFYGSADTQQAWLACLPEPASGVFSEPIQRVLGDNTVFISGDGRKFYQLLIAPPDASRFRQAEIAKKPVLSLTPHLPPIAISWEASALILLFNHPEKTHELIQIPMQISWPASVLQNGAFYLLSNDRLPTPEGALQQWWKERCEAEPEKAMPAPTVEAVFPGHHPIAEPLLIIDDEPMVSGAIKRGLSRKGFDQILVASRYEDALEVLEQNPAIRVVLSDYNLNDSHTGLEIARKVLAQRSEIRFLFMSGNANRLEDELTDSERMEFGVLEKPVPLANLATRLRTLFDELNNPSPK